MTNDDHSTLLELGETVFRESVDQLEEAFGNGCATFYWSEAAASHKVAVFSWDGCDVPSPSLHTFASAIDQLVIFAFGAAPDDVIRQWGEDHVESSGPLAITFAGYLRENAPTAQREWQS